MKLGREAEMPINELALSDVTLNLPLTKIISEEQLIHWQTVAAFYTYPYEYYRFEHSKIYQVENIKYKFNFDYDVICTYAKDKCFSFKFCNLISDPNNERTIVYEYKGHLKIPRIGQKKNLSYLFKPKKTEQPRVIKIKTINTNEANLVTKDCLFSNRTGINTKEPRFFMGYKNGILKSLTIMDLVAGKDLFDILMDDIAQKNGALNINERLLITLGLIVQHYQLIHLHGILHRDIKPENIKLIIEKFKKVNYLECLRQLEANEWQGGFDFIKYFDFDLSKLLNETDKKRCGTVGYIAPETFFSGEADIKSDLNSLGKVIGMIWGAAQPNQISDNEINNNIKEIRVR